MIDGELILIAVMLAVVVALLVGSRCAERWHYEKHPPNDNTGGDPFDDD